MIAIDQAFAFGSQWVQAWNAHDLDTILHHYDNDVEFTFPYVVAFGLVRQGTRPCMASTRARRGMFSRTLDNDDLLRAFTCLS